MDTKFDSSMVTATKQAVALARKLVKPSMVKIYIADWCRETSGAPRRPLAPRSISSSASFLTAAGDSASSASMRCSQTPRGRGYRRLI